MVLIAGAGGDMRFTLSAQDARLRADWAGDLAGTVVPAGIPENPIKERWLGIYDGAGIHGTDQTASLGTRASKGCVRMAIPDVVELHDQVEVSAPIYIG